ncbi:MAG TPA: FHA domain-containing protein, partial [Pirellulales bacterium]|nr:FHA domain-containing protein [Pirellulales bacterium]
MAELIAQGVEPHQRWRRALPPGERFVLGREAGVWAVPWDPHISRKHCALAWSNGRLSVERLSDAVNPIFTGGQEVDAFTLGPGEHFVIGTSSFTVVSETINLAREAPRPHEEQNYSSEELQRVRFRNADQRIEVLCRLPDVISGAVNDTELFIRLVNMLLAGVPRADAVALIEVDESGHRPAPVNVLHWDRRLVTGSDFQPSQRLILEAVRRKESVLHVWGAASDALASRFTVSANVDWAFCTPVLGEACRGWGVYVAGKFSTDTTVGSNLSGSADLREDLKFTELVASTLSSLRQAKFMQHKQAALRNFFAPPVLDAIMAEDPDLVLAPRETEVSVLFCDLRGFSRET